VAAPRWLRAFILNEVRPALENDPSMTDEAITTMGGFELDTPEQEASVLELVASTREVLAWDPDMSDEALWAWLWEEERVDLSPSPATVGLAKALKKALMQGQGPDSQQVQVGDGAWM
jgi:hypothetical protein